MARAPTTLALRSILAICVAVCAFGCRNGAARSEGDPPEYSDLAAEPPISLVRAIALAGERATGERFVHAELGQRDGRADCLVVFWCATGYHCLTLDAGDGALLREDTLEDNSATGARIRTTCKAAGPAVEPAKAIELAIAALPGSWAQLINLESGVDPLVYLVEVVAGEKVRYMRIDAKDGTVLSVWAANELLEEAEAPDIAPELSLASAIERAGRDQLGMIVLEAGLDLSSSKTQREWEVLLARSNEQLRVRVDGRTGEVLRSKREPAGELARTLAAASGVIEVSRAIDAAFAAVHGIAPDAQAIAALLANRDKGLVYQIALAGSSSGSRVVEVSAINGTVLSVEPVETPHSMRR